MRGIIPSIDSNRWIGNYDQKDKNTFLYSKKRCDEILASPNWKAWTTGKGYVYFTSKKGNEAALIMTAPKYYEAIAHKRNGLWHPRVRHRSFPGAKGCSTLDECRKIVEDRPYKTYHEWQLWNSGCSGLDTEFIQSEGSLEENQISKTVPTRIRYYNEPAWYNSD